MHTTATNQGTPKPALKWPLLGGTAIALLLCYVLMPDFAELQDEVGYMLRVTARLAFVFLMLAYVARPLVHLFGSLVSSLLGFLWLHPLHPFIPLVVLVVLLGGNH